jgi:hypothetical protein
MTTRTAVFCALALALSPAASAQTAREGRAPAHSSTRPPFHAPPRAPRWYPRVNLGRGGRAPRGERAWEPVQRLPPRGTMPPRPGSAFPWRGGGRAAEPVYERSQVIVGGRVLPDPPTAPTAGARLDAARDGGPELLAPPSERNGAALTERPLVDRNGRVLAPGPQFTALIGRAEIVGPIAELQAHWLDRRNHGYAWNRWGGVDVLHHYDQRGFHWWGFYTGGRYFWTRWHDGRFWWFDPYWRRWDFLYGGWWWWPGPGGAVYLDDAGEYQNCTAAGNGVLMTPDPTPPVVAPPAPTEEPEGVPPPEPPPDAADSPRFADYSVDGSRAVEIIGEGGAAYLYDLTVAASSDSRRNGQWLSDGVKDSRFVYEDKLPTSGAATPVKQIELTYDGSSAYAVVDPAGERKVLVSGDDREASLYDLRDPTKPPVLLARGTTDVSLVIARDGGRPRLKLVIVSSDGEARGAAADLFTRDGVPVAGDAPPSKPAPR